MQVRSSSLCFFLFLSNPFFLLFSPFCVDKRGLSCYNIWCIEKYAPCGAGSLIGFGGQDGAFDFFGFARQCFQYVPGF